MSIVSIPEKSSSITQYAWTSKPAASAVSGSIIKVTNVGTNGSYWVSNGSRWVPLNGSVIVSQSGTTVNLTGTTSETAMATITIPGGLIGTNGVLEILPNFNHPSSANNKIWRVRLGGIGGTAFYGSTFTTTRSAMPMMAIVSSSTSAQKGASSSTVAGLGTNSSGITTATVDTTVDFTIVISGQLASSGETMSLKGLSIVYRE